MKPSNGLSRDGKVLEEKGCLPEEVFWSNPASTFGMIGDDRRPGLKLNWAGSPE